MELIKQNTHKLGTASLCESLGVSRATYYRSIHKRPQKAVTRRTHPRRIPDAQRAEIRSILNSERFCDMSPAAIYTTMLDEGIYLPSERSLYRILSESNQNRPRHQRPPRSFVKPELLATKPNEVWSWDITKLRGPVKWTYYYFRPPDLVRLSL